VEDERQTDREEGEGQRRRRGMNLININFF
jgi:hypothetical protein